MKTILILISVIGVLTSAWTLWKKKYLFSGISTISSAGLFLLFSYFHQEPKEKIVIAIATDYAPYAYIENGEIKGIDVELLKHLESYLKKEVVLKPVDFAFLTATLLKGDADIAAGGLSATEEREEVLLKQGLRFTTAYCYSNTGILLQPTIKESALKQEFTGKILVQAGSLFVEIAKERFPNATIITREDFNIALEEFKEGKADAVISDALALVYFSKKHPNYQFKIFKLKHKITLKSSKGNAFIINHNAKAKLDLDAINNVIIKYKKDKKLFQEMEDIKVI